MDRCTNILYLGYAINKSEASTLYGASIAGNNMQINVLKNLSKYKDIDIKSITIYPTAAYPKGKLFINRKEIQLFDGMSSIRVSMLNIPFYKQFFETFMTYFEAYKIVKKKKIDIIFTFNMFPQIGLPAMWLKKMFGCKIVTLLADLPIEDGEVRNKLYLRLRTLYDRLTKKAIVSSDKIIALNQHGVESYAPDSKYIVVEGGIEQESIVELPIKQLIQKNIVYSGSLVAYSGIMNLIEAMKFVKNDQVILDIYGTGPLVDYVTKCAKEMKRVCYHGKVDNETMRRIQQEAYLLINPRPIHDPIAMVTFPSKIFEYMMSGTPVLTTKLNGFTNDYLDKMYLIENEEPTLIADKIDEIMELPISQLTAKAALARHFVIENKTWEMQCEKIYQFIKDAE